MYYAKLNARRHTRRHSNRNIIHHLRKCTASRRKVIASRHQCNLFRTQAMPHPRTNHTHLYLISLFCLKFNLFSRYYMFSLKFNRINNHISSRNSHDAAIYHHRNLLRLTLARLSSTLIKCIRFMLVVFQLQLVLNSLMHYFHLAERSRTFTYNHKLGDKHLVLSILRIVMVRLPLLTNESSTWVVSN